MYLSAMEEVSSELGDIKLYSSGPEKSSSKGSKSKLHCCSLDRELQNYSTEDVPDSVKKGLSFNDKERFCTYSFLL